MYKQFFKENKLDHLIDTKKVDVLFDYYKNNPYPKDHAQFHTYIESIGGDASEYEGYVHAILSCFLAGGKSVVANKESADFPSNENKMGVTVEYEHVDSKNDNPVVKYIATKISSKIKNDHLTERNDYYSFGKKCGIFDEI